MQRELSSIFNLFRDIHDLLEVPVVSMFHSIQDAD